MARFRKLTVAQNRRYRKRHYMLLIVALVAAFGLFGAAVWYQAKTTASNDNNHDFIASTLAQPDVQRQAIASAYGFSLSYKPTELYGSAIDGGTGQLYVGAELATNRPYQLIKLSAAAAQQGSQPNSLTLEYHGADSATTIAAAEKRYFAVKPTNNKLPTVVSTQAIDYGGTNFQKTVWRQAGGDLLVSQFASYTAIVNGKALTARTNDRLSDTFNTADIDDVMQTFSTNAVRVSYKSPSRQVAQRVANGPNWLDIALLTQQAEAATTQPAASQTVSSLYAPAVVKIYNVYCMDITVDTGMSIKNYCSAMTGSGFFVSSDGYLFTNGHVATANPKDIAIQYAVTKLLAGDDSYMQYLMRLATVDTSLLQGITNQTQRLDAIVDAIYSLPDNSFTANNYVQNLLVGLNAQIPDINRLMTDTEARRTYATDASLRSAQLIAADYRAIDGIIRYTNSDVAILKIAGNDFPITKLGTISQVSQGSAINILGYPALASDNGIVSGEASVLTLTAGTVSAIKYAKGDNRQLIETDTTIGHGNSGGPAIDNDGNVVGIATYTVDGSGSGNGTFNYIRDIQDARNLAVSANVRFTVTSRTQQLWEKAISQYDSSHYSAALTSFRAVKQLYPDHPTVTGFIENAQQAIAAGKDVKSLSVGWLLAGAGLSLVVAAYAVSLIVRHHGRHQLYLVTTTKHQEPAVDTSALAVPAGTSLRRIY